MKVIVICKKFHDMAMFERCPEVHEVMDNEEPEEALREVWQDRYDEIADECEACGDDSLDENKCWIDGDIAMLGWADGDTLEFFVVDVERRF